MSYVIPVFVGFLYHDQFKKGAFDLGRASRPIALLATLWTSFITIVFCLPTANPVTSTTLNYTPVAVGVVAAGGRGFCSMKTRHIANCRFLAGTLLSWFLSARKWFVGPIAQLEETLARVPSAGGNAEILGLEDAKDKAL